MANGRSKGVAKVDLSRMPGAFIALPWVVVDSSAFQGLSHPARSLLLELARQYVRDNNGRLLASRRYLLSRGWKSADVIDRAKRELLATRLIFETFTGHRPNKASWYALSWYSLDWHPDYDPGVKESFRRGGFMAADASPKVKKGTPRVTRPAPSRNDALGPSHGPTKGYIAPFNGQPKQQPVPSHGPVNAVVARPPVPSDGHHLEPPSPPVGLNEAKPSPSIAGNTSVERWQAFKAKRANRNEAGSQREHRQ